MQNCLTIIVWEIVLHRADWQLLLETIDLVQKQDDASLDEPPRIADTVEQCEGLLHSVDGLIFEKELVVLGNGDQEKNRRYVLKAVNPLLSLRSLPTNIEHTVCEFSNDKGCFGDTSRLDTRSQDILVVWKIVVGGDSVD